MRTMNHVSNSQEYKRTRHIQVKYHFIQNGTIKLEYCKTQDQLADIFTKGVNGPRLKDITKRLGIQDNQHGRESNYAAYHVSYKLAQRRLQETHNSNLWLNEGCGSMKFNQGCRWQPNKPQALV